MSLSSKWRGLKKAQRTALSIAVILGVAFGASYGFGVLTGKPFTAGQRGLCVGCTGFTILSMDKPNIISNDQPLAGLNYDIALAVGGGQSLSGTTTPEETKALGSNPSVTTKYPLTIEAVSSQETVTYHIRSQIQQPDVYRFEKPCALNTDSNCVAFLAFQALRLCPAGSNYRIVPDQGAWGYVTIYCVRQVPAAVVGVIDNPTIQSSSKWALTVNGERVEATVGRDPTTLLFKTVAEFNSPSKGLVATLTCPGGLFTGETWPNPANYRGLWVKDRAAWGIVQLSDLEGLPNGVQDVENLFIGQLSSHDTTNFGGTADLVAEQKAYFAFGTDFSNANNLFAALVAHAYDGSRQIISGKSPTVSGSQSAGTAVYTGQTNILAQTCNLRMKADWLGAVLLVGKPKITAFPDVAPTSLGDPATATVTAQNDPQAGAAGTFQVSVACGGVAAISGYPDQRTLQPGASTTWNLPLTTQAKGAGTCTASVCDVNRPSICDTKTAGITVTDVRACQEGAWTVAPGGAGAWHCENKVWNTNALVCSGGQYATSSDGVHYGCASPASTESQAAEQSAQNAASSSGGALTSGGAPLLLTCDFMCQLGKLPTIVWFIAIIFIGGVAFAVYRKRKRGY